MSRFISVIAVVSVAACGRQAGLGSGATDIGFPSSSATGVATYSGDRRPPTFPDAWPYKPGRAAVFGAHAMVASDGPLASQAGVEILQRGGNAVDAAVAVGFAMAVVFPEAGNIGGGGYMVIRMADGRTAALDYREIAPLAATRDMYLDEAGKLTNKSVVGPLASGVPGAVAGLTAALAKYGTMSLKDVMAPAIRLAEQGFVVDSALGALVRERRAVDQTIQWRGGVPAERQAAGRGHASRSTRPRADTASHRRSGGARVLHAARRRSSSPTKCGATGASSQSKISRATSRCGATRSNRPTAATRC